MRRTWMLLVLAALLSLLIAALNRMQASPNGSAPAPAASLSAAPQVVRDRLLSTVEAYSFVRFEEGDRQRARDQLVRDLQQVGWMPQLQAFEGGVNIWAERPGTDPAAGAVLLAAHYDTVARSPGADDNATGIATVLEVARLLGPTATPHRLLLALFDQEETGLLGSKAFIAQRPEADLPQATVILDMLGYSCEVAGCQQYPSMLPISPPSDRGTFLAALGDQGHPELLQAVQQGAIAALPVFSLAVPLLGGLAPDVVRSDHAAFWDRQLGAVLLTDTANFRNPHYHQPSDTVATLNPDFFSGAAQVVVNAVYLLTHRPANS